MNFDDIVYLVCLISCIYFGNFYRKIKDSEQQKVVGTALGVLILFIVSGFHILHSFISFGLCATAITLCSTKKVHIIAFCIMFGYLVFFRTVHYFNLPAVPGHTNMIQMILTLKMVGVAFEKNQSFLKMKQRDQGSTEVEITDYDVEIQSISFVELFHYAFNYIGVLTGPFYRYRTFRDYFETPFKEFSKPLENTIEKLKGCALYASCYLVFSYIWPIDYAMSSEFYDDRIWIYRLFYVWPSFIIFRMRIYTGLTLSEAVCTNAGFGAYPNESEVANGEGPKTQYLQFKRSPEKHDYNFKTIQNIDVYNTETCYTFREAMKTWNICVQYWLAVNIYKRFPSKKYRTAVTLLVSSFWHGFQPGHYMCIMGAPFYVPVEDMLNKAIRKDATGVKRKVIDVIFWINKFFAFSYLAMAFLLLTMDKIWHYYSSVYHYGYVWYLVLLVTGISLLKMRKKERRGEKKE
ncbi:MBOAT7 family protein [Megaselia abdita]